MGRVRLFINDDLVGDPAHCLVCARHSNFIARYFAGGDATDGFGHRSGSACFWSAILLRPIVVSSAATLARHCCSCSCLCWHAVLCDGTKSGLLGPPSRIKEALASRRLFGFGVGNSSWS